MSLALRLMLSSPGCCTGRLLMPPLVSHALHAACSPHAQVHLAEYGKARLLVLIEAMAEAYSIKRGAKAALLDKLNAELAEFA